MMFYQIASYCNRAISAYIRPIVDEMLCWLRWLISSHPHMLRFLIEDVEREQIRKQITDQGIGDA